MSALVGLGALLFGIYQYTKEDPNRDERRAAQLQVLKQADGLFRLSEEMLEAFPSGCPPEFDLDAMNRATSEWNEREDFDNRAAARELIALSDKDGLDAAKRLADAGLLVEDAGDEYMRVLELLLTEPDLCDSLLPSARTVMDASMDVLDARIIEYNLYIRDDTG